MPVVETCQWAAMHRLDRADSAMLWEIAVSWRRCDVLEETNKTKAMVNAVTNATSRVVVSLAVLVER